jgi:LysR family transcriptional regulator, chromosome initiation inhibitor
MVTIDPVLARTLATVLEEGTIEAAARRMHVTASAVSQRVKALEQQAGQVLLVRSRPARATPAGAAVARLAGEYALIERDALAQLGAVSGAAGERLVVPLAVNADSLATWFLRPLARVAAEHPVVFDLHRDDQDLTAGLLESGAVMGAVTSRSRAVAGCSVRALGTMRYVAVATPGYVAAHLPDGATAAALRTAPLIDFDREDDLQRRWLRARGVDPSAPPRHHVPASSDFATAVRLGMGWALLPRVQADADLADGRLVPLGEPPVDVPLHWQQWDLRSSVLDAVADALATEARTALAP